MAYSVAPINPSPLSDLEDLSHMVTDTFGRRHSYLRISLTERCNLRCTYCMPAEGVQLRPKPEILTFEEIIRLANLFARLGVTKIRLTGGEPLIRKDIEHLVFELHKIDGIKTLAITTNGLLLPKKLQALKTAGISVFNISLDTLRKDRFREITLRDGFDIVIKAIQMTLDAGYDPVKINCVVQKGVNEDELLDFVEWTHHRSIDVRFIEYMPFGGNGWDDSQFLPYQSMLTHIQEAYPTLERRNDDPNHTSKSWRVPGYKGSLGFISSMSQNFCGTCNRLRLTADGNLRVCLFGANEVSLRDALRAGATDAELMSLVEGAIHRKKASHAGMYEISKTVDRPMILIGG